MRCNKEKEAAARLIIRSHLSRGGFSMKKCVLPAIFVVVIVAMTLFGSTYAYNLTKFASPVLLVLIWIALTAAECGKIPIPKGRGLTKKSITIIYLPLIGLLAAYGYGWLALCWLFIWLGVMGLFALREKRLEEEEKTGPEALKNPHVGSD